MEVLIAASKKRRVEDRAAAEASGLKVLVVDVDSLAKLAAFELVERQLPNGGKDQIVALVDIGASAMHLTVLKNGQQVYAREQAFGGGQLTQDIARHYGMNQEEAEAAKRTGNLPEGYEAELLVPFMENLALEVSRALQFFFTSTQFSKVDHIVLAVAVLPFTASMKWWRPAPSSILWWRTHLPIWCCPTGYAPVRLLTDASALMVACGLALRRFDTA